MQNSIHVQRQSGAGLDYQSGIHERAYINGAWVNARHGGTIEVLDPATRFAIGSVSKLGVFETRQAISAANCALPGWQAMLPQQRGDILRRWYDLIIGHREVLAQLITAEQGKPIAEAHGEIDYAAGFVRWFAEEATRIYGETIPSHLPDSKLIVQREPIGVVAAITPWNFPSGMLTHKAAAALAAGCTVVAFPSVETPFSALALADLAEQAGIPAGVFSVLTGESRTIVPELCASAHVRALSFTGSTDVGRVLLGQSAATIKKVSMELGGHAPFIVFPDADLDIAVAAAITAKFQTSGQDCLAANRMYVHADIYKEFVTRFTQAVKRLAVGNGFDERVLIGPLINENAVRKCKEHVDDAVARGAILLAGGHTIVAGSCFFAPTVLAEVTADMKIFSEETFGPIAAIASFNDEPSVVKAANSTEFGLAAYVFTRDTSRALRIADGLQYGMVAINTVKITGAPVPFGGIKQSGLGREGGRHGIDEFTELKYICVAI